MRSHLTGKGHERLDAREAVREICGEDGPPPSRTWVYISGPNAFIEAGERVCREAGVGFFGARWS